MTSIIAVHLVIKLNFKMFYQCIFDVFKVTPKEERNYCKSFIVIIIVPVCAECRIGREQKISILACF